MSRLRSTEPRVRGSNPLGRAQKRRNSRAAAAFMAGAALALGFSPARAVELTAATLAAGLAAALDPARAAAIKARMIAATGAAFAEVSL